MSDRSDRAGQYAGAIVEAMIERWQALLNQAAEALLGDAQLAARVNDPRSAVEQRLATWMAALPGDVPAEVRNFLGTLLQQDDTELLPVVAEALSSGAFGGRAAAVKAEVTSAVELSAADKEKVRRQIIAQYGDGVLFSFRVDASLLGGLRVRVGDRLIDNSVASRLSALRETLSAAVRQ